MAFVVIDGYEIDAAFSEEIKMSSEVTEFPVEEGIGITDHVRNLPIEVTIEGLVSDTPIGPIADTRGIVDLPSETFLARLELIHIFRDPITVETTQRVYENMILLDLVIPRDATTGDALRFRASFKQIELVTNNRVEINVNLPRARRKKNLGAKNPKIVPTQVPLVSFPGAGSPELFPGLFPGLGAFDF